MPHVLFTMITTAIALAALTYVLYLVCSSSAASASDSSRSDVWCDQCDDVPCQHPQLHRGTRARQLGPPAAAAREARNVTSRQEIEAAVAEAPTLVLFYSPSCRGCKTAVPLLQHLAPLSRTAVLLYNTAAHDVPPAMMADYHVTEVPTLVSFAKGARRPRTSVRGVQEDKVKELLGLA